MIGPCHQGLGSLLQGQGGEAVRHQHFQVGIGQSRKNQTVHGADRALGEGKIPPPGNIIEEIGHKTAS